MFTKLPTEFTPWLYMINYNLDLDFRICFSTILEIPPINYSPPHQLLVPKDELYTCEVSLYYKRLWLHADH